MFSLLICKCSCLVLSLGSRFRLLTPTKPVQWPKVKWTTVDDAKLLVGVYEHGLGNWESIRDSVPLGLGKKILPENRAVKPQASHLLTRTEYLLRLLQAEAKRKMEKKNKQSPRKQTPRKPSKPAGSRSKERRAKAPPPGNETLSKYFKPDRKSSQKSNLIVNIPRDAIYVSSDIESNTSSTRSSSRGRKRTLPEQSTSSASKRSKTLSTVKKKTLTTKVLSRNERTPTPGSRSSPRKRNKETAVQVEVTSSESDLARQKFEMDAFEGISDDHRPSDIGEDEVDLDEETFKKVIF